MPRLFLFFHFILMGSLHSATAPDCAQRISQVEALTARYFRDDDVYVPDQCYGNACELARKIQDELGLSNEDGLRILFIRHREYKPGRHGILPVCAKEWQIIPDPRFLRGPKATRWKHHASVLYAGEVFDLDWNGTTRGVRSNPFFHAFFPRRINDWENWVVSELSPEWCLRKFPQRHAYPIDYEAYYQPHRPFADFVGELEAQ